MILISEWVFLEDKNERHMKVALNYPSGIWRDISGTPDTELIPDINMLIAEGTDQSREHIDLILVNENDKILSDVFLPVKGIRAGLESKVDKMQRVKQTLKKAGFDEKDASELTDISLTDEEFIDKLCLKVKNLKKSKK